jgi:hypothetical protein
MVGSYESGCVPHSAVARSDWLLDDWMGTWEDFIAFEVHSVITPEEAGERIASQFQQR